MVLENKNKTISSLRSKLVSPKHLPLSCYNPANQQEMNQNKSPSRFQNLQNQELMNMKISNDHDLANVKKLLQSQLQEAEKFKSVNKLISLSKSKSNHQTLKTRCSKLKEILDLFDSNIQFNQLLILKQKDVEKLNSLLKTLAQTLIDASQVQNQLSLKSRSLDKTKHQLAISHSQNNHLTKRLKCSSQQISHLKQLVTQHEQNLSKFQKLSISQKCRAQVFARRMDGLERGILAIQKQDNLQAHSHLKHVLSVVIREHQQTKKELSNTKRLVQSKNQEISKLKAQVNHTKIKLDELLILTKRRHGLVQPIQKIESVDDFLAETHPRNKKHPIKRTLSRTPGHFYNAVALENGNQLLKFHLSYTKSLDFRIEKISDLKVKGFVQDVLSYGPQTFLQVTLNSSSLQRHLRMKAMIELFISTKDFSQRLNSILNAAFGCLAGPRNCTDITSGGYLQKHYKHMISIVNENLFHPLKVDVTNLWICELQTQEIWTIVRHSSFLDCKQIRISQDYELLGEVARTGQVLLESNVHKHPKYDPNYHKLFKTARKSIQNSSRESSNSQKIRLQDINQKEQQEKFDDSPIKVTSRKDINPQKQESQDPRRSSFIFPIKLRNGKVIALLELIKHYQDQLTFDQQYLSHIFCDIISSELSHTHQKFQIGKQFSLKQALKPTLYKLYHQAQSKEDIIQYTVQGVKKAFSVPIASFHLVRQFKQGEMFENKSKKDLQNQEKYYFQKLNTQERWQY